jgi:hypothetical protein
MRAVTEPIDRGVPGHDWQRSTSKTKEPQVSSELFADGIREITVTGTIVRIDLTSLSVTERDANNNPVPVFRQRIIMPIDAFANAVDLMQKALVGLVDAGAVRRMSEVQRLPTADNDLARAEAPSKTTSPTNTSPNFN